ncbi:glycosyltransferase [Chitinophaga sp. 212800010-3]|uniref:glycosyltransferase family 2 protein n=1 Tax=unclassified Chitinophaga TaxID=2619133 RepID=UPI002DF00986|nr:hypothetical protein [Chitinophaga sp. 212800010-3]
MIKEQPLVSVIVPCYNREKYIEQCVMSVIHQTYPNIELVVVDDGSTDKSGQILEELAAKHGFTLVRQKNMGVCAALNNGIRGHSTGEYICYLGSDDYWKEDKIEKQVAFLEEHQDLALGFTKTTLVDSKGNMSWSYPNGEEITCDFYNLLWGNFVPSLTTMMRRDVYVAVGGFDENLVLEDWDMWLRIAYEYKYGFLDEVLAYYRIHDNNMSKDTIKMKRAEQQTLQKWRHTKAYKHVYKRWALDAMNELAPTQKKYVTTQLLLPALKYYKKKLFYTGLWKLLTKWE